MASLKIGSVVVKIVTGDCRGTRYIGWRRADGSIKCFKVRQPFNFIADIRWFIKKWRRGWLHLGY